ncbi:MAG TPA: shikimate dehydrogenase [Planctomycetaceae bacterium]|jgi:3-dehydroquinate dehydratase/shikimate dehydrogenase|nr:shikimate dehydrogenase [Planctomycetaceae bacterium]
MICVSIGRTRHKMVVLEHRALAARGAQFVELRLDWLQNTPDLGFLLNERPTPVIMTCRRPQDQGRWRGSEEQRLTLLRAAIAAGVEYIDLEHDIARDVRRYGKTKRVISYHNFEETPEDLEEIHERLAGLDPDIVKIVTMANSPVDAVRMLRLVHESKVPTVGFCMGELGLLSRLLCGRYGAPFTYASFSSERELAPGQISFDEMRDVYHYDKIDKQTQVYGVIGDPVAHSLSPLVQNAAFQAAGFNGVYLPFRVFRQFLSSSLDEFQWLGARGYSVTIPHKEAVLEEIPRHDDMVDDIGASNTLYRDDRLLWHAANTDYEAALAALRIALTRESGTEEELVGKKVLMLGAGGAARAIGLGLVRAGCGVTVTSRTHARAVSLAQRLGCQQIKWENRGAVFADILVNCTPVGMFPNVDDTPFPMNWFRDDMVVFDTVYNPENTLFLKQAREHACRTVSGIEMFVRQAALQYEYFTGRGAPVDVMRETLRRGISPVTKIV